MSDTPRTDKAVLPDGEYRGPLVWSDDMRQLERELIRTREMLEVANETSAKTDTIRIKLERELTEAKSDHIRADACHKEDHDGISKIGIEIHGTTDCGANDIIYSIRALKARLTDSLAREVQLREALTLPEGCAQHIPCVCHGIDPEQVWEGYICVKCQALSLPPPQAAIPEATTQYQIAKQLEAQKYKSP